MKKAQITAFMIMGLILVLSIAIFFFIKNVILTDIEPDDVVPAEIKDIQDFVLDCLNTVSRDAIEIIGLQGGYIYLPDQILRNNDAYVDFVQGSDLKVPLWYYLGNYRLPFFPEMENDINSYIIQNLPNCINNFEVFEHKYIVDDYEIQPSTFITENDIFINLLYPLEITTISDNQQDKIDLFEARHDVRLKEAYDLAYDILRSNEADGFLEHRVIDLMVIDPEIPFSGLEFSCRRKTWNANDLIERMKGLFSFNLPSIRIHQTNYIPFRDYENYESLHFLWNLSTNNEYKNFFATVDYDPDWGMYMNARPRDGETLRSSTGEISFLNLFCLNNYHFTYDLRFPVRFRLYDPNSFSGQGFEFLFSLPVYIESNAPLRYDFGLMQDRFVEYDEDFCSFRQDETYIFRAYDNRYGLAIDDVDFYFDCITKRCYLGKTSFDGFGFDLEASLPEYCTGGFLVAEHPNYEEKSRLIYYEDLNSPVTLNMREMKTLNLEIFRRVSSDPFFEFSILNDYEVLISMTDSYNNKTTYLSYPLGNDTIRLPYEDSSIHLELFLVDDTNFILGGYNAIWNYSRQDMVDANTLILNVYEQYPSPINQNQSMQVYNFILNETKNLDMLEPKLVFKSE
ncbi:MAG: hypothetical protein ACMXX8_00905 [Candidatus Woesearchaeota archaeon]